MTDPDSVLRELPHAVGPEKSVLSTILQYPDEFIPVAQEERLTAGHFYLPSHSTLFGFLLGLFQAGERIELVSLVQKLIDKGLIQRIGGPSTLTDIYTYAPSPGNFRIHAAMIREKWVGRSLIETANRTICDVYDSPDEIGDTLAATEKAITAIITDAVGTSEGTAIKELVEDCMDRLQSRAAGKTDSMGIPTISTIDNHLRGAHPGRMMIIGGYPEAGKSLLALQMLLGPSTNSIPCDYFSLELSAADATERAIIQEAEVNAESYANPTGRNGAEPLNKSDMLKIQRAAMDIAQSKLIIKRLSNRKIQTVVSEIRRSVRERATKIIAVDYAQKIIGPKCERKDEEYAEISHQLYELAVELGIFLIIPSQLNADGDTKGGRVFEEDADFVINIVQDRNKESETYKAHRHLLVVKDRHNSQGGTRIPMILDKAQIRFIQGDDPTNTEQKKPRFNR
jgi:replicative DNA helicase